MASELEILDLSACAQAGNAVSTDQYGGGNRACHFSGSDPDQ